MSVVNNGATLGSSYTPSTVNILPSLLLTALQSTPSLLPLLCDTKQRARLAALRHRAASATAIQSAWRARTARRDVGTARAHAAAAREVQRTFRGHLGRKAAQRRRDWSATPPGPQRVKLGLRLIEDTRASFARQQGEMDALHKVDITNIWT
jgi:IQ calmodulin-binding motif